MEFLNLSKIINDYQIPLEDMDDQRCWKLVESGIISLKFAYNYFA